MKLPPKAVVSLSLALHELATNAAKYGALSTSRGRVAISWYHNTNTNVLRFEWREEGGPAVMPPVQKGFGSTLVERLLVAELGGKSESFTT
jgi:two-component sensor histidine kinase